MIQKIPSGKKRQFSQNIKVNIAPRVKQPDDQSFVDGVSLTLDCFDHNAATGRRDRFVRRETVRFPHTVRGCEAIAEYFEQNCEEKHLSDFADSRN
jgi:hypothetical protein